MTVPPAGWHPDPWHLFEKRYWDGEKWTSHVANGSLQGVDDTDLNTIAVPTVTMPTRRTPEEIVSSSRRQLLIVAAVVGVAVLLAVGVASFGPDPKPETLDGVRSCEQVVERRLRAPSTAEFAPTWEASVSGSETRIAVTSYVDAENGFGAKIRTYWSCVADATSGSWRVDSVGLDD